MNISSSEKMGTDSNRSSAASASITPDQLYDIKPKVLTFHPDNSVDRVLEYDVFKGPERDFDFRTLDITDGRDAAVELSVPVRT